MSCPNFHVKMPSPAEMRERKQAALDALHEGRRRQFITDVRQARREHQQRLTTEDES